MNALSRLTDATLAAASPMLVRPGYDRRATGARQLHLGVGAFFKAHQAVYADAAMSAAGGDWRIRGVSLRRPDMRDALAPQDFLYTVAAADAQGEKLSVVTALSDVLVAPENPRAVIDAIADPTIAVITLTITEKGYCLSPATGDLDFEHPEIAADLRRQEAPATAIGYLVAGLRRRQAVGASLPGIVSCDNLSGNGEKLRRAVSAFAEAIDPRLARAIGDDAAFPSTMVDRIVPAATPESLDAISRALGLRDEAAIRTEPFSQWVIEDAFNGPRPAWEHGGAILTANVAPFELAKLRLLNGAHSSIAYLGYLAGHETVADAMADPAFDRFIADLQTREIAPVTPAPEGMPLRPYIEALQQRFKNPTLNHKTFQIAMDGSQKIPQRLLNTVRAQLDADGPITRLALAVGAWTRYVSGIDECGRAIDVRDPMRDRLAAAAKEGGADARARARAFLAIGEIFGSDLPASTRFADALGGAIESLASLGAATAVMRCNEALS